MGYGTVLESVKSNLRSGERSVKVLQEDTKYPYSDDLGLSLTLFVVNPIYC